MGKPRIYFEGNNVDNDSLQDLLDLLENTCVDPEMREERWGVVVISKSGGTLETAAAYRVVRARGWRSTTARRRDAAASSSSRSPGRRGKLRDLCEAEGSPTTTS